jgi:hypothetical protein
LSFVAITESFVLLYSPPVTHVIVDFIAKHDILGIQQAATDFGETSSLPGLKTCVAGQAWFTPFAPHVVGSSSQHVVSEHDAAFVVHFSVAFAATTFKPFFFVWHE